jgi:membrane-bound serine protease (ClpP class)
MKFLLTLVFFLFQAPASSPVIVQIDLDDIVHPISADYIRDGLTHAKDIDARAVILRIDTPGGLIDSMRDIVEAVLASPVPVITWVGPSGARAASAGFFVLLAGDVAVMAPGTNTGAAHPVTSAGGQISPVMEAKVVNDATAYLRSYTSRRGRNPEVAERGITQSQSFTAEEALKERLIDAVIGDIPQIIEQYDGMQVRRIDGQTATLHLRGAMVDPFEMTTRQRILSRVLNPNIAFLLALIGLIGLYVEITHGGLILPGVIGAISLVLALFSFNLLPVSWAGVALIVLAIGLFVLEATVTSHGILALGGCAAMIAGALMLVQGPIPQLRIQLSTALAVTVPVAIISVFLVRLVYVSHKKKSATGSAAMIGEEGVARTDINPEGKVLVHGEYWNASSETPIPAGSRVRVVRVHGLKLEVEPVSPSS